MRTPRIYSLNNCIIRHIAGLGGHHVVHCIPNTHLITLYLLRGTPIYSFYVKIQVISFTSLYKIIMKFHAHASLSVSQLLYQDIALKRTIQFIKYKFLKGSWYVLLKYSLKNSQLTFSSRSLFLFCYTLTITYYNLVVFNILVKHLVVICISLISTEGEHFLH